MKNINTVLLFLLIAGSLGCSKKSLSENAGSLPLPDQKAVVNIAAANGALGDTNIKYFGRWDFSSATQYVSYWGGAYFKVQFTGTTVKIKVGTTTNYYVKIDNGPWISYLNGSGTINLTPTPLANGTHTLSVAQGKDYNYVFNFQGLILDAGATTSAPSTSTDLIEFIGDSITTGYTDSQANVSDYAWVCAEALGAEHTQIAFPGITLVDGFGINATKIGMDVQYFKAQSLSYPSSPAWDFTKYTPTIVVINLGQNDQSTQVPDNTFQTDYVSFLTNVRTKFPNAQLFAMRPFSGAKATPLLAAVNARIAAGDNKLHYVNTTGWLTMASDFTDGLHPSISGHIKAANLLQPILAPYISSSAALANGTYKIVNRNSGLVVDAQGQGTVNGTPIQQWSYSGANNQRWTVTNLGGGQYRIVGVQSNYSLDVTGQSTADGAKIQLYNSTSGNNQKWTITPISGGYYTIKGVQSGKLMEVAGSGTTTGTLIQQWTSTGANNQQWAFQTP